MSDKAQTNKYDFYFWAIQLTLIIFKIIGLITYSWWYVLTPLLFVNAFLFVVAFIREFKKAYNEKLEDKNV